MALRFICIMMLFFAVDLSAQDTVTRLKSFNIEEDLALEGYDPVSYFDGKPLEGSKAIPYSHNGIKYYFSNAGNRAKFMKDPAAFEPAYGGWCAYAMGESGEKVKVDPETFKIVDGKLLLFYNFWGNNTLKPWNKNEAHLKASADKNWRSILGRR